MTQLTPRQIEVLQLAASGLSNLQIGIALGIKRQTVANHLHAIYETYETSGRLLATLEGIRRGDVNELEAYAGIVRRAE